jgi:tyrosyl-tRNA synthetase
VQVGGSDQWGNITAGVDLIRRVEGKEAHGFVAPLITTAAGKKFGKTEGGAVWLDPKLTSPYQFYQFWINTDDRDVEGYLKIFTFKTRGEIEGLMQTHGKDAAARTAQRQLAADMTTRVHGGEAAAHAERASQVLFGELDVKKAPREVFAMLSEEIPTSQVAADGALTLVDAVVSSGLAGSKSEARRLIEQNAMSVNGERATDVARTLAGGDWLNGYVLLRKGKKDYALLRKA